MQTDKALRSYSGLFGKVLVRNRVHDADGIMRGFQARLEGMYGSDDFRRHGVYPSIDTAKVYAIIALCLELRERGWSDGKIIDLVNSAFAGRKRLFYALEVVVDLLPGCYAIVRKWNVSDHAARVADGSIDYDSFEADDKHVAYSILGCRYVDMFEHYGIRPLCKIFCMSDTTAYEHLTKHLRFIRCSDLSDGPACRDEIVNLRARKDK